VNRRGFPPVATFGRETPLANVLDSVYLSVDCRAVVTPAKQIASEIDIAVAAARRTWIARQT
jgi:hypothetical protein